MKTIHFNDKSLQNFYKIISRNIIQIRKDKKISQLKLANAIGHQNATFLGKAELLVEKKHFNLEHLYKISTVLEVDISEFFKDINDLNTPF